MNINETLQEYIEKQVLPIYEKNDIGHGIEHIKYVIRRSFMFANQFENVDLNMVYVIAVFHDLAHHLDKDCHEVLSAKLFYENEKMKEFFTDKQRIIIKEAIEDHRASLEYEPRSNYGKIISSADRNVNIVSTLKRTHAYTIKHYSDLNLDQMVNRAYKYISEKFGNCGYAKMWCSDEEFDKFKKEIKEMLKDKYIFGIKYMEANDIMITKQKIQNSIKYVVDNSKHVRINKDNIDRVLPLLKADKKKPWLNSDYLDIENFSQDQILMYLILCESLNFCYWDSDIKWKIEYKGEWYSGSFGLFYAISKAIKNGYKLLDIDYLEKITIEELDDIFKGTTSIPLLKERFIIIKELVSELKKIPNLLQVMSATSDIELLNKIINHFKNFRDISLYKGQEVYFFKRAILLVGDLILNIVSIKEKIKNDDNMLGCADYKIPQVLRQLGILEYTEDLSKLIDENHVLEHDSEMEIEIRANMLYAIELIKDNLRKIGINMNSVQIDNSLWLLSKSPKYKGKPHHLSRTIYY